MNISHSTQYSVLSTKTCRKLVISLVTCLVIGLSINASANESQFDKYGGWRGLKGEKTGWFHTEQINGRWWLITPDGNVFWSLGVYCVRIGGIPEIGTDKRAYREACVKKYGNEKEWARVTKIQLKEWGFNTIGDWSSASIIKTPGLAYVVGVDLSKKAPNVIPEGSYGYFPDVFDSSFKEGTREKIKEKLNWLKFAAEDPWLLGYFLADEPSWYGSKGRRGGLVDDFIRLDGDKPGKIAWVDFLKSKYSDISDLNRRWNKDYSDYRDLLDIKKLC